MRNKCWLLGALCAAMCLFLGMPSAYAHPMGNFSINHCSGIRIDGQKIELTYIIDEAEIPTYQALQENNFAANVDDPSIPAYLRQEAALLASHLLLDVNGQTLRLELENKSVIFPPGAGGLPTMKMGFVYIAKLPGS